jgi:SOS response regulatory protein OraA/RecX
MPRLRDWPDDTDPARAERTPTPSRLYGEAVRALARREMTTQQLREKLTDHGARRADVEAVLSRLTEEGALDDRRAARTYAHAAFRVRKRARARIIEELGARGVPDAMAREAVEEVCGPDVELHRLEQAVIHALRGTRREHRDRDARRLFATFLRQGYDADDVRRALALAGVDVAELE